MSVTPRSARARKEVDETIEGIDVIADAELAGRPVMAKDPVCGMNVDEKKAATASHGGKAYYFCSAGCRATFEKAPEKYAAK